MPAILSSGVVVVRCQQGRYHYLMLRAYSHWDFPKGMVEEGETPLDAARREVEEETTVTQLDFHWGSQHLETGPYGRQQKTARYYIAETLQERIDLPINPELGRPEHEEYRWVSYQQAQSMITERVRRVLEWAHTVVGEACEKG